MGHKLSGLLGAIPEGASGDDEGDDEGGALVTQGSSAMASKGKSSKSE